MRSASVVGIIVIACVVLVPFVASSRQPAERADTPRFQISTKTNAANLAGRPGGRFQTAAAVADTFLLAEYSFEEHGDGSPQGWTLHDQSSRGYGQTTIDTFFHVASGVELNGGQFGRLLPLAGNKSMWCGTAPGALAETCHWGTLPGYGNGWIQRFESISFDVTGDVVLSYMVRWDSEPAIFDYTTVEYLGAGDDFWVELPVDGGYGLYEGIGSTTESFVIPAAAHGGTLKIRFHFRSDGAWSDEDGMWPTDGAVLIDSLTVADSTGVLSFQNFEAEPDGAHQTNDGHWLATTGAAFGEYGALFPGVEVLQEGPCAVNISHLWGFFSGSTNEYACGGHPEQLAVPFAKFGGIDDPHDLYMNNAIWSPPIDWTMDINGVPIPSAANLSFLEFDVYRDLPLDNLVFYAWYVRSVVAGCAQEWQSDNTLYYGDEKDWFRHVEQVADHVASGATEVQISLEAADYCGMWCGLYGSGACHSHAPLFDNVRLIRTTSSGPYWSVNEFDLFQDNFAGDGTTTGTVRMDNARYDGGYYNGEAFVSVFAPDGGIDSHIPGDSLSGPAVYCHVKDVSPAKSGAAISADLVDYPVVATGAGWTVLQCLGPAGATWMAEYSVGLNDHLYTPGDTVYYYFSARDKGGITTYWSLSAGATSYEADVVALPNEVTCLPANALGGATDILYIDNHDNLGAQPFFESAFEALGLTPDRYDILAPKRISSNNNGPGSRVVNVTNQIIACYRTIVWNSGDLRSNTIGDGASYSSDDFALLFTFLDQHPNGAGLYLSGNNIAEEWITSGQASAINLRNTYMNFNLVAGDHVAVGEPVSPLVVGQPGSLFDHPAGSDSLIATGACPTLIRFDVLAPTGASALAGAYSNNPAHGAVLTQVTNNSAGDTARVVLSGFSYHRVRDDKVQSPIDRVEHLLDILRFLDNEVSDPTAVPPAAHINNSLAQNYPNPFNPTTAIQYSIQAQGQVSLRVYDVAGRLVRSLVNEVQSPRAGGFAVTWDGTDDRGTRVASGIYFYKLTAEGFDSTRKMLLLK